MKNIKKQIRKELSQKLVTVAMAQLGGLKKQNQKKFFQYLDNKMGNIADYYTSLLNKKAMKTMQLARPECEMQVNNLVQDDKIKMEIDTQITN